MKKRKNFMLMVALLILLPISLVTASPILVPDTGQTKCYKNALDSSATSDTMIVWAKSYGAEEGLGDDYAKSIQQTTDGGYIVAGYTTSFGVFARDALVIKLDENGDIDWQMTYVGDANYQYTYNDEAHSIQQTTDGGYIVAGRTTLKDEDIWIFKLNSEGEPGWQKIYGGSDKDYASSIHQTSDKGYIVAGNTSSFGAGDYDFWILKLGSNGDAIWQKTYGGSDEDRADTIQQTSDEGYILAGSTHSFGTGSHNVWVLRLNANGDAIWQKTYGESDVDSFAHSIQQTSDGEYIVSGHIGTGDHDFWILKLGSNGDAIWQKTYGGSGWDEAHSIQQTTDGGYIVAGETFSVDSLYRLLVLKLDSNGNITWQRTYGGENSNATETGCYIYQTSDGKYILTSNYSIYMRDFRIFKFHDNGEIPNCEVIGTINVAVNNTSIVGQDSNAMVTSTNVASYDTNISSNYSSIKADLICQGGELTTSTTIMPSECYIDSSCTTDYYVRNCLTGTCVYIEQCNNLWACADACDGYSCGNGTEECIINPSCTSDVQTCGQDGYCILISGCKDRVHSDKLFIPYPCPSSTTTISTSTTTTTINSNGCPPDYPIDCGNGWCCPLDFPICLYGEDEGLCSKGGCISESLYGEHSQQTELLRYLRDNVLSTTPEGQELIKLYYELSPAIVKAMQQDEEFKQEVKEIIDGVLNIIRGNVE